MFSLTVFLWDTVFLYPLKIFVVLLHEISHGVAAVLTGGEIVKIEINYNQSGVCYTRGGIRMIVLSAGYLGSMLWGGLILILAARTKYDRTISIVIGIIVGIITVFYIRNLYGIIFSLAFCAFMISLGKLMPMKVNDIVLKFIGITSSGYAIIDIKDDLISRTVVGSDAYQMAEIIPLPSVVWGIIWIIISIFAILYCLKISAKGERG